MNEFYATIAVIKKMIPNLNSVIASIEDAQAQIARLQSLCDLWTKELNRRVEVEQTLWNVAGGKRPPLTPDECRELAVKLSVNQELQKNKTEFVPTNKTDVEDKLTVALSAALDLIKDLWEHEGAEGFSSSTRELSTKLDKCLEELSIKFNN